MFTRLALLLLLAGFLVIESSRIANDLKTIGKRFFQDQSKRMMSWGPYPCAEGYKKCMWNEFPDKKVDAIKANTGNKVMWAFLSASSTENSDYEASIALLEMLMDPDAKVTICENGDGGKKMNGYQYLKYLRKTAKLFRSLPPYSWDYTLGKTGREDIQVNTTVWIYDKFNVRATLHYDIRMQLELDYSYQGKPHIHAIREVFHGGNCPIGQTGVYEKKDEISVLIDDIEELKSRPTVQQYLNLFTPEIEKLDSEETIHQLPTAWLAGFVSGKSKMFVCHGESTDSVEYTENQFHSWYNQFGLLWHPKSDATDSFTIDVETSHESVLGAIVTMKLQMAESEAIHDWKFKFGALATKTNNITLWHIDRLEVLCTPGFNTNVEYIRVMPDIVVKGFVDSLQSLPEPTEDHSSLTFVETFTKKGLQDFQYDKETGSMIDQKLAYLKERRLRDIKMFTKYSIKRDDIMHAPHLGKFSFFTISNTNSEDVEYENEWKFEVKWDEMNQFYEVEKLEIGPHKRITVGEYGERQYVDIEYRND